MGSWAIASVPNVAKKRHIEEGYPVRMESARAAEQKCSEKALIITNFFNRSRKRNKEEKTNHLSECKSHLFIFEQLRGTAI
jgi:hypothetical protein